MPVLFGDCFLLLVTGAISGNSLGSVVSWRWIIVLFWEMASSGIKKMITERAGASV
jgi:hypothetical protein